MRHLASGNTYTVKNKFFISSRERKEAKFNCNANKSIASIMDKNLSINYEKYNYAKRNL